MGTSLLSLPSKGKSIGVKIICSVSPSASQRTSVMLSDDEALLA